MMMLKSVLSKYARGRCGRNLSRGGEGRSFCSSSSRSPKDNSMGMPALSEETKTILPFWQQIFEAGKITACGVSGIASGYALASFVLPNHSKPLIKQEQRTRASIKETEEFLIEFHDMFEQLEEGV